DSEAMGWYGMIPLHGVAQLSHGISGSPTFVVRMRSQFDDAIAPSTADFALVRSKEEFREAVSSRLNGIFFVGNVAGLESDPELANVPRLIGVSARFNYFGEGDIIGFHPQSQRFRTLYRRASGHNSFLVTDRCNHYCLMCSQPPKDVDDRW